MHKCTGAKAGKRGLIREVKLAFDCYLPAFEFAEVMDTCLQLFPSSQNRPAVESANSPHLVYDSWSVRSVIHIHSIADGTASGSYTSW